MAVGRNTVKGEVYKISIWRTQEQEVEIEVLDDGEDILDAAWETADDGGWANVETGFYEVEQVTCGGEI